MVLFEICLYSKLICIVQCMFTECPMVCYDGTICSIVFKFDVQWEWHWMSNINKHTIPPPSIPMQRIKFKCAQTKRNKGCLPQINPSPLWSVHLLQYTYICDVIKFSLIWQISPHRIPKYITLHTLQRNVSFITCKNPAPHRGKSDHWMHICNYHHYNYIIHKPTNINNKYPYNHTLNI